GDDNGDPVSATNRVRLDCPVTIDSPGQDTTVMVDVYITNDKDVAAFTLGFFDNSSQVAVSDIVGGPALPVGTVVQVNPNLETNKALVLWYDGTSQNPLTPKQDERAFTLVLSIPAGAPAQDINLDSVFVGPSGYWLFAFDGGGDARPAFDNCGSADVVIR
ncbi:MAG: hypothetical protein ABIJ61_09235, partial [bacterium]